MEKSDNVSGVKISLKDDIPGLISSLELVRKNGIDVESLSGLSEAVELSNYLYVVGQEDLARSLLLDFIYYDFKSKDCDLWDWNSFGIALLASIARNSGKTDDFKKYLVALSSGDWLPTDRVSYAKKGLLNQAELVCRAKKLHLDDGEEFELICELLGDGILQLRYYKMLFFEVEKPSVWVKLRLNRLDIVLEESTVQLRELIVNN